jgi:hypothetical protein
LASAITSFCWSAMSFFSASSRSQRSMNWRSSSAVTRGRLRLVAVRARQRRGKAGLGLGAGHEQHAQRLLVEGGGPAEGQFHQTAQRLRADGAAVPCVMGMRLEQQRKCWRGQGGQVRADRPDMGRFGQGGLATRCLRHARPPSRLARHGAWR